MDRWMFCKGTGCSLRFTWLWLVLTVECYGSDSIWSIELNIQISHPKGGSERFKVSRCLSLSLLYLNGLVCLLVPVCDEENEWCDKRLFNPALWRHEEVVREGVIESERENLPDSFASSLAFPLPRLCQCNRLVYVWLPFSSDITVSFYYSMLPNFIFSRILFIYRFPFLFFSGTLRHPVLTGDSWGNRFFPLIYNEFKAQRSYKVLFF